MKTVAQKTDACKITTNRKVTPQTNKPITKESIRTNIGCLKIKGKSLFKSLMEEKKIEREF
jgi:hypothetical protein